MPTIQISKIQMRRGPESDLPNPSLDDGEIGFANDVGRLFIGQTNPTFGNPNYNRNVFPYQNIEILTESSPLDELLAPAFADNQKGFISSVPLIQTGSWTDFEVYDSTNTPAIFHVDLPGCGVNAIMSYFIYDSSNNPIRHGTLDIIWNVNTVGTPLCIDNAIASFDTSYADIEWQAVHITGHVKLQYKNQGVSVFGTKLFFKIDRPLVP